MSNMQVKEYTVGAWIPNAFEIRMVHGRSVLVPTIHKQNIQNGRFSPRSFYQVQYIFFYIVIELINDALVN